MVQDATLYADETSPNWNTLGLLLPSKTVEANPIFVTDRDQSSEIVRTPATFALTDMKRTQEYGFQSLKCLMFNRFYWGSDIAQVALVKLRVMTSVSLLSP